jgi:hypothetical protein
MKKSALDKLDRTFIDVEYLVGELAGSAQSLIEELEWNHDLKLWTIRHDRVQRWFPGFKKRPKAKKGK